MPACLTPVPTEGRAMKSRQGLSVTVLLAGLGRPVQKVRGTEDDWSSVIFTDSMNFELELAI